MTTLSEDAAELRRLKQEAERLDALAEVAKAAATQAELALWERMEQDNNTRSVNVDGINFVRARTEYAQIQDSSEFVDWAEENAPELLEPKARKKILNELVRERLNTGEELPPGVGFYVREYISQRAA